MLSWPCRHSYSTHPFNPIYLRPLSLSHTGRGGGTNVHPGNIKFRELIQQHRRAYLKARKNDKPAISRMIVRVIRQQKGRFLKKDDMAGVWLEIGDDAAREKTSQALRQRAPEVRKLMYLSLIHI